MGETFPVDRKLQLLRELRIAQTRRPTDSVIDIGGKQ